MVGHMVVPAGTDWIWIFSCPSPPFCPGGSDLGLYPYSAGDCDLCHVHGPSFHILAGWLLWGEELTAFSWIGGTVIVFGSAMLLWKTRRS